MGQDVFLRWKQAIHDTCYQRVGREQTDMLHLPKLLQKDLHFLELFTIEDGDSGQEFQSFSKKSWNTNC